MNEPPFFALRPGAAVGYKAICNNGAIQMAAWKHHEVFPIIESIIAQQSREHGRYVTTDEIATQLLQDDAAKPIIAPAEVILKTSADRIAHNMVAWFSQRITVGDPLLAKKYERTRIDDRWAYRVALGAP